MSILSYREFNDKVCMSPKKPVRPNKDKTKGAKRKQKPTESLMNKFIIKGEWGWGTFNISHSTTRELLVSLSVCFYTLGSNDLTPYIKKKLCTLVHRRW